MNKVFRCLIGLQLIIGWYPVMAQEYILEEFKEYEFVHDQTVIPYRLFTPESKTDGNKFPLIVALHGAENFASDPKDFLRAAGGYALGWLKPAIQENYPCFILAPHIYKDISYYDSGYDGWEEEKSLDFLEQLIELVLLDERIDPNRIYLTGHSMGGAGSLMVPLKMEDRFAALVPISSAVSTHLGTNDVEIFAEGLEQNIYANLGIWAFHHNRDSGILTMREIVDQFKIKGYEVNPTHTFRDEVINLSDDQLEDLFRQHQKYFYTEYSYNCDYCHMTVMDTALAEPLLAKWLFRQYKLDPEAIDIISVDPDDNYRISWQAKNEKDTIEVWFRSNEESNWTLLDKTTSENNPVHLISLVSSEAITTESRIKLVVLNEANFAYGIDEADMSPSVTAIPPDKKVPDFVLYPNPASGELRVRVSNHLPLENLEYQLVSATGSIVMEGQVNGETIDVEGMPAGVYLMIIHSATRLYKQKLVLVN